MADKEAGEIPKGLSMSLDALIKEEKGRPGQQKQQNGNMGNRRDVRGQQRGRGRGPHGQSGRGGRGRFNDFPQQTWQGAPPQQGRFQNPQRMVTVDTGAQQGQPGMGPILLLPPEFLAQQQGGFGASAGPFMPMHLMGGGFPGQPLRPGQAFGQPQQPPAPRTRETCHEGEESGEVVIRLRKQDILKVSKVGEVTMNTGGTKTQEMFRTLNNALSPLGIRVTDLGDGQWSISDGHSLMRFHDGVVLPSKGAASAQRAKALMAHYKPGAASASAAATAASNAAAAAMGLMPSGSGGGGSGSFGTPATGFGYDSPPMNGFHGGPDRAQQRRMKAQGRYSPY